MSGRSLRHLTVVSGLLWAIAVLAQPGVVQANVAPSIPGGTPITYGFVEGNVPAVNDNTVSVEGSPVVLGVPDLPWCPDPVFDDEGFFPCPCPACMAPCQFPAEPEGECKGPDGSIGESTFTCCCCGGSESSFRPFTPHLELDRFGGGSMLFWLDIPGAEMFDIVRGDLDALRGGAGDFGQATGTCADNDNATTSLYVDEIPPQSSCWWFLIRGEGGSYDSASGSQSAPRDAAIAASANDCP